MFPVTYVPRYPCSPVGLPIFPGTYVPRTYVPQYHMFLGTYVPRTYIPQYVCSPVPMFPDLRLTTVVHHPD